MKFPETSAGPDTSLTVECVDSPKTALHRLLWITFGFAVQKARYKAKYFVNSNSYLVWITMWLRVDNLRTGSGYRCGIAGRGYRTIFERLLPGEQILNILHSFEWEEERQIAVASDHALGSG